MRLTLDDARTGDTSVRMAQVMVATTSSTSADVDATAADVLGVGAADWLAQRTGRPGPVVRAGRSVALVPRPTSPFAETLLRVFDRVGCRGGRRVEPGRPAAVIGALGEISTGLVLRHNRSGP